MITKRVDVKEFKKLIIDLYKIFPNGQSLKEIEKVIIMEKVRKRLHDEGILLREKVYADGKSFYQYMLGPNGLFLVSAWKTENFTKLILGLTIPLFIVAVVSLIVAIG